MLNASLDTLRHVLLWVVLCGLTSSAAWAATVIPLPDRRDFALDETRRTIYITTSSAGVLRYNLNSGTYLPGFAIAGNLYGLDISPDGNTLAVADYTYTNSPAIGQFWLVDLETQVVTRKPFPLGFMETGSWSVAWGSDNNLYFSVSFQGSGWTPIRRWNRNTDTIEVIAPSATQSSMLSASGDRHVIAWVEPNNSSGPVGTYDILSNTLVRTQGYNDGTGWFNYELANNKDGSQLLVPTYGGLYSYNDALTRTGPVYGTYAGIQAIAAAFLPGRSLALMPMSDTRRIRLVDTQLWTLVGEYATNSVFSSPYNMSYRAGRIKVSGAGDLAITSVAEGLQITKLKPTAIAQSVVTNWNTPLNITLGGQSELVNPVWTYTVVTGPSHGVVSGLGSSVTYTPVDGHCCADRFAFTVSDGVQTSAPAWVDIAISAPPPPTATPLAVSVNEDGSAAVQLAGTSPAGLPLSFVVVSGPTNGALSGTAPQLSYAPGANYFGNDSFTYKAVDAYGESAPVVVSLSVAAVNDQPTFALSATSISVKRSSGAKSYAGFAHSLNAGAANESGQTFSFTVQAADPSYFTVQPAISASGTLTFTPSKKTGQTVLTVTMKDNGGTANGGVDTAAVRTVQFTSTR